MATAYTKLKKISVHKFRALENVDIEFGTNVTVICGKNGTSKSSILGVAAQIFSFDKDYVKDQDLSYNTIAGDSFKSLPAEHFRFSEKFDVPGSLSVGVELFDGYTNSNATAELELMKRTLSTGKARARPVVRKNSTVEKGNSSRNFTHPVIYLSLKRLQPIPSREYAVSNNRYLSDNKKTFLSLSNKLLNKTSSSATATSGTINSAVAHADSYDQDSVSAGEDNVGQIVQALMSFRKLKDDYPDYKGGLLLIDEADAGLFPAAQLALIDLLGQECNDLGLQVVMTSHSPTLIERVFDLSQKYQRRFKTVYLSDTFGPVKSMLDMSWADIYADLHIATVKADSKVALPQVNVYFEDAEGADFFSAMMQRQPCKKFINIMSGVSLGCSNYIQLIKRGVPEFSKKSVVVLDADAEKDAEGIASITLLPGGLPPDQLIFQFLYNMPADDPIWRNDLRFNRPLFVRCAQDVIGELGLGDGVVDVAASVAIYRDNDGLKRVREIFKKFYKTDDFQRFLSLRNAKNPWRRWVKDNQELVSDFRDDFIVGVERAMRNGYGVDAAKLSALRN